MSQIKTIRSGVFFGRPAQQREENKGIVRAFRATCFSPAAWLLLLYSLVLHTRFVLGFWPYQGADEAPCLSCDLHSCAAFLALVATFLSPISLLVFLTTRPRFFLARRDCRIALLTYTITLLIAYLLVKYDPELYSNWF